jgi:hypothetical protein
VWSIQESLGVVACQRSTLVTVAVCLQGEREDLLLHVLFQVLQFALELVHLDQRRILSVRGSGWGQVRFVRPPCSRRRWLLWCWHYDTPLRSRAMLLQSDNTVRKVKTRYVNPCTSGDSKERTHAAASVRSHTET